MAGMTSSAAKLPILSRNLRRSEHYIWVFFLAVLCGCGRNENVSSDIDIDRSEATAYTDTNLHPEQALRIALDQKEVTQGEVLHGRLMGAWDSERHFLRLIWSDGLGRVVSSVAVSPKSSKRGTAVPFSLRIKGGYGRYHALTAAIAPKENSNIEGDHHIQWRTLSKVTFCVRPAIHQLPPYAILLNTQSKDTPPTKESLKGLHALGINGTMGEPAPGSSTGTDGNGAPFELPYFISEALPTGALHPFKVMEAAKSNVLTQEFLNDRTPTMSSKALFDEQAIEQSLTLIKDTVQQTDAGMATGLSLGQALSFATGSRPIEQRLRAETLPLFHAWLMKRYPTLEALNTQWGTTFRRWDQVRPPSTDEAKAQYVPGYDLFLETLKSGDPEKTLTRDEAGRAFYRLPKEEYILHGGGENFSGWCDLHAFKAFAATRLLKEYRSMARNAGHGLLTGMVHPRGPSAWNGLEWYALSKVTDWLLLDGQALPFELLRSFNPDGKWLLSFSGEGKGERERLWNSWMRGASGVRWSPAKSLLREDNEPAAFAEAFGEDLRSLAGGFTAQRDALQSQPDILLYYSPRSQAVHWLLDSLHDGSDWPLRTGRRAAERDSFLGALQSWVTLLEDLGYTPGFIHPEQLLRSEGTLNAKVLVLPKVLCLGEREAQAIRNFSNHGGIVIADSECGLFDAFGKRKHLKRDPKPLGTLDREFGVTRTDFRAYERNGQFLGDPDVSRVVLEDPRRPIPTGPSSSELRLNEPGLRATDAWHYGRSKSGAAAVLSKGVGTGRFIYLNLAMQDYLKLRAMPNTSFEFHGMDMQKYRRVFGAPTGGEALRTIVGDILSEALGDPLVSIRHLDNRTLRGFKRRVFQSPPPAVPVDGKEIKPIGRAALIAFMPPSEAALYGHEDGKPPLPKKVSVVFERQGYWYDLRNGTYLGFGARKVAELQSNSATVLSVLDYRVTDLQSKVRRTDPTGSFKIEMRLEAAGLEKKKLEGLADHVLHVEVFGPEGNHLPHYSRSLTARGGVWSGSFMLGLNEPAGRYTWSVTDILTGLRTSIQLQKDGRMYGDLFAAHQSRQEWIPRLVDHKIKMVTEKGGTALLTLPLQLVPKGQGLTHPPQLDLKAPAPWKVKSPLDDAWPRTFGLNPNPTPTPLSVDLVMTAKAAKVANLSEQKLDLGLTYRGQTIRFQLPYRLPQKPLSLLPVAPAKK